LTATDSFLPDLLFVGWYANKLIGGSWLIDTTNTYSTNYAFVPAFTGMTRFQKIVIAIVGE
jgi:hypothetical protein